MELPKLDTGDIKKEFKNALRANVAEKMVERFRQGGFQGWADYFFEAYNVDARYENTPDSEERKKLNTESGLIIANHPGGGLDTPAILNTLSRDTASVKIVAAQQAYRVYGSAIGKDLFIPVPKKHNFTEGKRIFQQILGHINDHNGVVLFYPSGVLGKTTGEFQSGFRVILSELSDNKMIYCFNFNEVDMKKITRGFGRAGIFSEGFDLPIKINRLRETLSLNVEEKYTQAVEWKSLINSLPTGRANVALKEHYWELFEK